MDSSEGSFEKQDRKVSQLHNGTYAELDSAQSTDDKVGSSRTPQKRIVQLRAMVNSLGQEMWQQATDRESPDWPPAWLKFLAAGLMLLVGVAIVQLILVPLLRTGIDIGGRLLGSLGSSDLIRATLEPVRKYLTSHASGLSLSPDRLWVAWSLSGGFLFIAAYLGSMGARIGWAVFGVLTSGMVWAATPQPSEWVGAGLTMTLWSLLSILSYRRRRARWRPPSRRGSGRRAAELRGAAVQRRAEDRVEDLGYDSLKAYFGATRKRRTAVIADELGISFVQVRDLHRHYISEIQQDIAEEYFAGGQTYGQLSQKHGWSEGTIGQFVRRYKRSQDSRDP